MTEKARSFNEHYRRLEQIANKVSQQKDLDVDQLLDDVKEAIESYDFCKARLDAATVELDRLLNRDAGAASA